MNEQTPRRATRRSPGRRDDDKPSAWTDPRFWASILGILLTILIFFASQLIKQMDAIHADLKTLSDNQIRATTSQGTDISNLKDYRRETHDNFREQTAYNLGMSKSMTEITTTLKLHGVPTPNVPDPPKFGGQ